MRKELKNAHGAFAVQDGAFETNVRMHAHCVRASFPVQDGLLAPSVGGAHAHPEEKGAKTPSPDPGGRQGMGSERNALSGEAI